MTKITYKDVLKIDLVEVDRFLDLWDKMTKSYFWKPPSGASDRRQYEDRHSMDINFNLGGIEYKGTIETRCSCSKIYCFKELFLDGKKKRITSIKSVVDILKNYGKTCPKEELPLLIGTKYESDVKKRLKSLQI